jgi:phage gp29-like protein
MRIVVPAARTRWMLPAAGGMTPEVIGGILQEALTGTSPRREQELYSLMEATWPRLQKNTAEVKEAVCALNWSVRRPQIEAADTGRLADLLDKARLGMRGDPCGDGMGWEATLRSLLDAWFRGIAVLEIDWESRAAGILPRQTREIPPWHYGWRRGPEGYGNTHAAAANPPADGRLVLYQDAWSREGVEFPPDKFLIGVRRARRGHSSGGALLRPLAWWWCAANFSAEWLLNFAQVFGQPLRRATYAAGQEGLKAALEEAMEAMGAAPWIIHPEGTTVDLVESTRSGRDNPQSAMLDRADTACDLLVLGQTLTTDVGDSGSRALGEVHSGVRSDIIDAAANWLAEVLNEQFVPALARLNPGPAAAVDFSALPWWEAGREEQKDVKVLAETLAILTAAGIPVRRDFAYELLDFPEPQPGEPVIGQSAPPAIPDPRSAIRNPQSGGAPAAALPPTVRQALAKMPLDAREYFLARL